MRKRIFLLVDAILLIAAGSGYLSFKAWCGDFAFHAGKQLYYEEHDYAAALERYKQVKELSAHYATAQRYIGHNIYGREWGKWDEGIPYLDEALRIAPDDSKVLEDAGRAYIKIGRLKEGTELLRRANTDVAQSALAKLDNAGN